MTSRTEVVVSMENRLSEIEDKVVAITGASGGLRQEAGQTLRIGRLLDREHDGAGDRVC
jgi:hypothetical protein